MKRLRFAGTVALLCLLFAALAYATPRQQDEPKSKEASPAEKQEGKPEAKPETQEQRHDEMKQEKDNQDKRDAKDQEKENKQMQREERKDEKSGKNAEGMGQENRMHGKPAGKGGHIPDDKFRASFGKSHTFHPSRPTVVNGQPTLVYGGYTLIMVDPWPADWAYTDECYIDYVDGEYFLFDMLHPGVQVALFVSM